MFPYIRISGTEFLSTYNLMAACGLLAAILSCYAISKKQKIPARIVDNMSVMFVFIILAAGFMAVLVNNFEHGHWDFSSPKAFLSGFTFYGGLIGGGMVALPGCIFLGRKKKMTLSLLDILAVSVMVGHSIGRIGCFLGGCCYGKTTNGFLGIPYPINGEWIRVYPVQLYESLFLFLLFLYSYQHLSNSLERYFISYGIFRFFIEFLRGDNRGTQILLSPSQWISIILVILGFFVLIARRTGLKREDVNLYKA